jgi:DNA mismatch repair protein MutS
LPASSQVALLDGEGKASSVESASAGVAPIRRQYLQIKRRFPDTILLFRLGDFYETFDEDAEIAASVLDIVLTGRDLGKGVRAPMAGIPHHAADGHIARLVAAGHKVAICEQIGSAERGRGLIERDVTRVVTPGTVTDPAMLDSRRNTFLAAVAFDGPHVGVAHADASTGEFAATQITAAHEKAALEAAAREVLRIGAVEVVMPAEGSPATLAKPEWLPSSVAFSTMDGWHWKLDRAVETLNGHFGVSSLDGFGLDGLRTATRAAGALLAYLQETQRTQLSQIASLRVYRPDGYMHLDAQARRNLELTESSRGERRHSLISVLDETCTAMGARLLRRWLAQPLLDVAAIQTRLDSVARFADAGSERAGLRQTLKGIGDLERLTNRAVTGAISPKELMTLRESLAAFSSLPNGALSVPDGPTAEAFALGCTEVLVLLERALPDAAPGAAGDGGLFRPGFAPELDGHRRDVQEARAWISGVEREERERTGIRTLKVGYNRVFGYYIEVSAAALATAEKEQATRGGNGPVLPAEYQPRQTLANGSRYVTARLKDCEARVLGAQEMLAQLEADAYQRLVAEVAGRAVQLLAAAAAVAHTDVLSTLAEVASTRNFCRPVVDESTEIEIIGGRHPTLEMLLAAGEFVPNDAFLNTADRKITILTGPNMAGKSSWLRQTALIVLMAQIGSFVPAATARIGLVDRIFTRIGAQDDIATGQSTFMVEMVETANILHHATQRSLVLLDEIGRGTSTWDGLAIARAVVEYLHNAPRLGCRTLFATHFHELTELAGVLPGVCCARLDVLEEGDRVVFLHQVVPGAADRSYGVHVAELAGVPRALTRRAHEILSELERGSARETVKSRRHAMTSAPEQTSLQLTLFAPPSPVVAAIKELDVESLSPLEALTKLYELKSLVSEEPAPGS